MNKVLIVFLILIIIGAGIFYFFFLRPSQEESAATSSQVEKVNTTFNLAVLDELNSSFVLYGNVPVTVNPSSLRKNYPDKANDPFYN